MSYVKCDVVCAYHLKHTMYTYNVFCDVLCYIEMCDILPGAAVGAAGRTDQAQCRRAAGDHDLGDGFVCLDVVLAKEGQVEVGHGDHLTQRVLQVDGVLDQAVQALQVVLL